MRKKTPEDLIPLTEEQFILGMENGKFCAEKHRGFSSLLFHSGVRVSEALRAEKEQFQIRDSTIFFDVGPRLKHGLHTPPLPIPLEKPYASRIQYAINKTRKGKRVFPYCRKTGYNIIVRVWKYPHHFRLTKITELFRRRFSLIQIRSWSGHASLQSLDSYAGIVDIEEMGKS